MIVDGKALAEEIKKELKNNLADRNLRLDVVWVGDDPVSAKYVERKKKVGEELGVEVIVHNLMADIAQADLETEIEKLNNDGEVDGIIIQLPLPAQIETQKILDLISPNKDIDALGKETRVLSPIVGAIKEIFEHNNVDLRNKKIIVVGNGKLVGRPISLWLTQEGHDVSVIDVETKNPDEILKQADIIISGVGKPGLITPDKIRDGVVLIDAGTADLPAGKAGSGGQLRGDADPACAEKCSLFTPVPGGVGPLTVVMLFKNLLELNK